MKWFEGNIPTAIQTAKNNKAVFIVFIAGENAASSEMESYLHQEQVTQLCEENDCVAVKLAANSNECKFFSQIYPVVLIPSTFFIGDSGVPLEVIGECKSPEDFLIKVQKAVEFQKNSVSEASAAAAPVSEPSHQREMNTTKSLNKPEASASSQSFTENAEEGTSQGAEGGTPATDDGSGDDLSVPEKKQKVELNLGDKVDRAKELLEKKKEEKLRKEADEEKRKEKERRSVGQGVQKLRQSQKEMEILEAKKEFKREKEEDRLARQRVREEIARDRAEKAARFQMDKDERTRKQEEAKKQKLLEEQAARAQEQVLRSETARIQFRLPNGSSVTQQFPATENFSSVYDFIVQHMNSSVSLSTTFPRRTFTSEDHSKSLRELQLAPSAVILVIPAGYTSSGVRGSSDALSIWKISRLIFAPVMFVWNIIASALGLSGSSQPPNSSSSGSSNVLPSARGGDQDRGSAQKRPSSSSRQDGAIRRFRNAQDDEDDNDRNTWNGNSTQQM